MISGTCAHLQIGYLQKVKACDSYSGKMDHCQRSSLETPENPHDMLTVEISL